jgi:hypothetical protein
MTADTVDQKQHPQGGTTKPSEKDQPEKDRDAKDHERKDSKDKKKTKEEPYEEGPQYEEGDPAKGKLDPEDQATIMRGGQTIPIRDRRAYLIDQAVKNESANDEINAREVEANKRIADTMVQVLDPDRMRDESMENSLAEIDMHTQEYADKARAHRQEVLRANALRGQGFTPEDHFIAGPPAATETASHRDAAKK